MAVYHLPPLQSATVAVVLCTVSGHLMRPLVATATVLAVVAVLDESIIGMVVPFVWHLPGATGRGARVDEHDVDNIVLQGREHFFGDVTCGMDDQFLWRCGSQRKLPPSCYRLV